MGSRARAAGSRASGASGSGLRVSHGGSSLSSLGQLLTSLAAHCELSVSRPGPRPAGAGGGLTHGGLGRGPGPVTPTVSVTPTSACQLRLRVGGALRLIRPPQPEAQAAASDLRGSLLKPDSEAATVTVTGTSSGIMIVFAATPSRGYSHCQTVPTLNTS